MKGFVPTPPETVDRMVETLFGERPPKRGDRLLDPGCGEGAFIEGVIRWCAEHDCPLPHITGVESDPRHVDVLRSRFRGDEAVRIVSADFLAADPESYEFIVGNPPYVPITALSEDEKRRYRARFVTARGRFDLYLLFFEQALNNLAPDGRLVFITPEKYLYVDTAGPLRRLLGDYWVEAIELLAEDAFPELVTYPTITAVRRTEAEKTKVVLRDGTVAKIELGGAEGSWLPLFSRQVVPTDRVMLKDVCERISCGVATGADRVFVHPAHELSVELQAFARPTVAGRELIPGSTRVPRKSVMLLPYDAEGRLLAPEALGALGVFLGQKANRHRLMRRTCVRRKPWYAFHETPMLRDMLRPKILFKDISATPEFWVDLTGEVVPRHSVYYLVPPNMHSLRVLLEYLESPAARLWLTQNCQRAANDYLRLQSRVLQRMPLPDSVVSELGIAADSRLQVVRPEFSVLSPRTCVGHLSRFQPTAAGFSCRGVEVDEAVGMVGVAADDQGRAQLRCSADEGRRQIKAFA
jgi:adenine-specific DNA-methyltransferase